MDWRGGPEALLLPAARAVVLRWSEHLADGDAARLRLLRFLAGMILVRVGQLREVRREVRDGQAVAVLVNERDEEIYAVPDPLLGAENERLLLDELQDELLLLLE
jgi:hypothetical protein